MFRITNVTNCELLSFHEHSGMPMMPMPPGMMPPRNAFMLGVIPPLNPINPAATAPAPQPPAPSLPLPTISSAASQAGPGKLLFPAAASVVQVRILLHLCHHKSCFVKNVKKQSSQIRRMFHYTMSLYLIRRLRFYKSSTGTQLL